MTIMGKYLVTCWLAILLILLQSDVSVSKKRPKPSGGGYPPPRNPGYPHNPGYPQQNPGYPPPRNPGYPQQYPGYPQRNPGYPQQYPGYPQRNPGYPQQYPGYGGGYGGGYGAKPWKPKPAKPLKTKHVLGAAAAGAAAGAVGGYLLGSAMSNMHFGFRSPMEERWWYENRDRYSDRVYYPEYKEQVSRDVFVRDCVNVTVTEYIKPQENKTADEMEVKVVTHVVHEMCTEQYRLISRAVLLLASPSLLLILALASCFLIP